MALLRSIFGPSKDEIWSKISEDIGGKYINGGFWGKDILVYEHKDWQILLDTYTVGEGEESSTYTRMRAPFVNKDGFYFQIYRTGLFTGLGKALGMQDIEIGDPYFNKDFVIKSNSEEKVRQLLADRVLRERIRSQPRIHFEIQDDEGWFGPRFQEDVDQLYFRAHGIMKEREQLHGLFELFSLTLSRLVQIDSAYEEDPCIRLA